MFYEHYVTYVMFMLCSCKVLLFVDCSLLPKHMSFCPPVVRVRDIAGLTRSEVLSVSYQCSFRREGKGDDGIPKGSGKGYWRHFLSACYEKPSLITFHTRRVLQELHSSHSTHGTIGICSLSLYRINCEKDERSLFWHMSPVVRRQHYFCAPPCPGARGCQNFELSW